MYNNILIYIVGHPPEESPNPSEMHIFQCSNVRARDVVEDIKSFMNGGGDRLRYNTLRFQLQDTVLLFRTVLLLDPVHFQKYEACLLIGSTVLITQF